MSREALHSYLLVRPFSPADGFTKPVIREKSFSFRFPETEKLPPPVMPFVDVSFHYPGRENEWIYKVRAGGPSQGGQGALL